MTGNKPVKEFRMGFTTAAIFEQPLERGSVFNVSISRLYKPDEDAPEWKRSTSFGRDDLPHVNYVAGKAHEWIHMHQQASRRAQREADAATDVSAS